MTIYSVISRDRSSESSSKSHGGKNCENFADCRMNVYNVSEIDDVGLDFLCIKNVSAVLRFSGIIYYPPKYD